MLTELRRGRPLLQPRGCTEFTLAQLSSRCQNRNAQARHNEEKHCLYHSILSHNFKLDTASTASATRNRTSPAPCVLQQLSRLPCSPRGFPSLPFGKNSPVEPGSGRTWLSLLVHTRNAEARRVTMPQFAARFLLTYIVADWVGTSQCGCTQARSCNAVRNTLLEWCVRSTAPYNATTTAVLRVLHTNRQLMFAVTCGCSTYVVQPSELHPSHNSEIRMAAPCYGSSANRRPCI